MARIVQLFKNLKYISKKDLRKNHLIEFSAEELLVNMLYYVPNSSVVRPNALDGDQTIDVLCKTKKSLARFGDGEILIISGKDIPFQQYDEKLAKRMQEFLWSKGTALNFDIQNFPRTQDLEPIYSEAPGAYVFTKETFVKYNRRVGIHPYIHEISEIESRDIDYLYFIFL